MLLRPFVLVTLLLIKAEAEGSSLRSLGLSSTLENVFPDSSVVPHITDSASTSGKTSSSSSFKQSSSSQFVSSSSVPEIIASKSYSGQGSSYSSSSQSSVNSSSYAKSSYSSSDKGSSAGDESCKDPQSKLSTLITPISDMSSTSTSESSSSKIQSSISSNKKAPSSEILPTVNHQVLPQAQEIIPINYTPSSSSTETKESDSNGLSLVGNLSSTSLTGIIKPVAGGKSESYHEQTKSSDDHVPEPEIVLSAPRPEKGETSVSSSSGSYSYSSSNEISGSPSNGINSSLGFQQSYNSQSSPSGSSAHGIKDSKSEHEFSSSSPERQLLKVGHSYSSAEGSFAGARPSIENQLTFESPTFFNPNSDSPSTVTGSSYVQSSTSSNKVSSSEISAEASQKGPLQLGLPSAPFIINRLCNRPSSVSRLSSTSVSQTSSGSSSGLGQQVLSRPLAVGVNSVRNRPTNLASTAASLLRSKTGTSISQPSVFSYQGSSAKTQQVSPIWAPLNQITTGGRGKSFLTNKSSIFSSAKKSSTSQTSYSKTSGSVRSLKDTLIPPRFHQPNILSSDESCQ